MKLRHWFIILFLVLVGSYFTSVRYIKNENLSVDMVEINDKYMKIKAALEERDIIEENVSDLEGQYHCDILLSNNLQYDEKVAGAIKENKVIIDLTINNEIIGKVIFDGSTFKIDYIYDNIFRKIRSTYIVVLSILLIIMSLIYFRYIRPFKRLQNFASHISRGELDIPLPMTKNNYFGAFTESFDILREELKKAREGEYEANISKKELVASLSHDIKTPVSTIKAICEILMIQVKEEKYIEKIKVINKKASVIDSLITDMFHATLEDLEKLKTEPREELSTILMPMFEEINYYQLIQFENELPECLIYIDRLRINEVIDNIINNSYKYANTKIFISFHDNLSFQDKNGNTIKAIKIKIRDEGTSCLEEDLPYISGKYYRGDNAKGKTGSGLGLYLANVFMNQMEGNLTYYIENGFVVELLIRRI